MVKRFLPVFVGECDGLFDIRVVHDGAQSPIFTLCPAQEGNDGCLVADIGLLEHGGAGRALIASATSSPLPELSATTTFAPPVASNSTVARPTPETALVTMATSSTKRTVRSSPCLTKWSLREGAVPRGA